MVTISIQFHALPGELFPFVKDCISDFRLHAVAMRFFPFAAIEITGGQLESITAQTSPFTELAFTLEAPTLPVESNTDFGEKNPDRLRLDIERQTESGLRQCWLTCRTERFDASAIWKEVAKRLKAMTRTGVVAVNCATGATSPARSFRYTAGAKALEQRGVPMLPSAGGCILRFIP